MGSAQKADVVQRWVVDAVEVLEGLARQVSDRRKTIFRWIRDSNVLCEEIVTDSERLEYEGKVIQQMFDGSRRRRRYTEHRAANISHPTTSPS
ncbi:hypothetical protein OBBRIDRAFT_796925 [Obba rivulosa]|uniref:Uncharacterized protein n=1 Tax=Obba rivulosa TaxID=1052685 RepID=A0A8E2AM28_9APHY|nr:hypothetical protein OBBRIDRAFT_796925 [Obba rivulosa]